MNKRLFIPFLALLLSVVSTSVLAEIYQCRDAKGKAVFSQTPCPKEKISGNTEVHKLWREMQILVNEGSSIYQLLGADVESILYCKKSAQAFAEKLNTLDGRLDKLSKDKANHLILAQKSLRECGQCESSSQHHCNNATKELNLQMNLLLPPLARKKY